MEDEKNKKQRSIFFTVITVNLMTAVSGMAFAWSSPSVPKLQGHAGPDHNPLPRPATIQEISWITALHNLGALCGPLATGAIASRFGKKRTLLLFAVPQLLGNTVMVFATEVAHFCAARFLLGLGTGCVFAVVPAFVAEVADDANRGRASIVLSLSIVGSQLFLYCVAPYVTISTFAAISLTPSVLFLLLFGLRGVPETAVAPRRQRLRDVERAPLRRSFVITLGLMFFQQFTGGGCVASYMQTIFDSSGLAGHHMVMIVGAVQLAVTILVTKVADEVGRKKLLGLSYSGQLLALFVLGVYFHLRASGSELSGYFWLPVAAVLVMLGSFKLGCGPVSWTVSGEVFPPGVKYYMNSLVAFEMTVFSFVVNLSFPTVAATCGMAWTAWGFAVIAVLALLFVVYAVPETKGMSLEEIQVMLGGGKGGAADETKV